MAPYKEKLAKSQRKWEWDALGGGDLPFIGGIQAEASRPPIRDDTEMIPVHVQVYLYDLGDGDTFHLLDSMMCEC